MLFSFSRVGGPYAHQTQRTYSFNFSFIFSAYLGFSSFRYRLPCAWVRIPRMRYSASRGVVKLSQIFRERSVQTSPRAADSRTCLPLGEVCLLYRLDFLLNFLGIYLGFMIQKINVPKKQISIFNKIILFVIDSIFCHRHKEKRSDFYFRPLIMVSY